jgi:hypothetical protein
MVALCISAWCASINGMVVGAREHGYEMAVHKRMQRERAVRYDRVFEF